MLTCNQKLTEHLSLLQFQWQTKMPLFCKSFLNWFINCCWQS